MDAARKGPAARNTASPSRRTSGTARKIEDTVTAGLQKMFAAIAEEPIPDDFLRLLDEIEAGAGMATDDGNDRR